MGHAAMIGEGAPAVGGPHDLDALLYPPPALPPKPGRVREYTLTAIDRRSRSRRASSSRPGRTTAPSPAPCSARPRATSCACSFVNAGSHPHTIHFHGIHPANMDGVFEIVEPGDEFTYEFEARPAGFHPYHCHSTPLKKHIHKGLYGALIIDPTEPRPEAQELVMVMNGYDTDGDGGNNFYTVNGRTFYYARYPIQVSRSKPVRHLPREPDRVRPDQLVPPPRGLLPLPAERHRRPLGVHRHSSCSARASAA